MTTRWEISLGRRHGHNVQISLLGSIDNDAGGAAEAGRSAVTPPLD